MPITFEPAPFRDGPHAVARAELAPGSAGAHLVFSNATLAGYVALAALAAALLAFIGRWAIGHWWYEASVPDSYYAYTPIVPFIVAAMFYKKRRQLGVAGIAPCYPAMLLLVPALALLVLASRMEMPALQYIGLGFSIWSSVWLIFGTRWVRTALIPLLFLATMAPLPGPLLNDATYSIQHLSIALTTDLLRLMALHPVLSGNVITLENFQVFVDVPCSGFRLLLSLVTCFAAVAYLFEGPLRSRVALLLVSIPLSIAVNVVRRLAG